MPRPLVGLFALSLAASSSMMALLASTAPSSPVAVALQPLAAQVARVTEALQYLGAPLPDADRRAIEAAIALPDERAAASRVQEILDRHCLLDVHINPESRVHVTQGRASAELVEQGWRTFLVKVRNEAGVTAPLRISSPQALRVFARGRGGFSMSPRPEQTISARDVADRWLDLNLFDKPPLVPALSGLAVEYRILQLYSRDAGQREASLAADVGQGTQDIGFRNDAPILFRVLPSNEVTLRILDERGQPADGVAHDPRRAGTLLSVARKAARAGLRLPAAGLPRRRRRRPPGRRGPTPSTSPAGRSTSRAACRSKSDARAATVELRLERWIDLPLAAGTPAIITSTRPAACTTRRRRRASSRAT